jgi:PIN domain nuclease of toxin-antitoxin system
VDSRFLFDTHILMRCLTEPAKLSRDQLRVIERAAALDEHVAISDVTLLEIAFLLSAGRLQVSINDLLGEFDNRSPIRILPVTPEIASDVVSVIQTLRDPLDSAIVATARVHGLRLLTSGASSTPDWCR